MSGCGQRGAARHSKAEEPAEHVEGPAGHHRRRHGAGDDADDALDEARVGEDAPLAEAARELDEQRDGGEDGEEDDGHREVVGLGEVFLLHVELDVVHLVRW